MTQEYHEKKMLEFAASKIESTATEADRVAASIDYNIMIGHLEDPEEQINE